MPKTQSTSLGAFFGGTKPLLVASTVLLCTAAQAVAIDGNQNTNTAIHAAQQTATTQKQSTQLAGGVAHTQVAEQTSSFANQPIGFGADTDEFIVTRDLTAWKYDALNHFDPKKDVLDNTNLTFWSTTNATSGSTRLLSTPSPFDDDSYVISMAPSQRLEAIKLCAAENITTVFTTLSKNNVECYVHPHESADSMEFKKGAMLLVADRDMEIELNVGKLTVAHGSIVLIANSEKGTAIYNFHDTGRKAVCCKINDQEIPIVPGKHLHATKHDAKDFASINELDRIAHRRLLKTDGANGIKIYSSEFSTLSAIEAVEPIKKVLTSDHPDARKLAQNMIKTSAVLMHLGAGSEDFKHHLRPRMTALRDSQYAR